MFASDRLRLAFLLETAALEAEHLVATDQRLFAAPFDAARASALRADPLIHPHPAVLAQAVNEAHGLVPMLVAFVDACTAYAAARRLA